MLVTLDPSASEPQLTVYTMNEPELLVKAYAVSPEDWPAYIEYRRAAEEFESNPIPPGQLVYDEKIKTNGEEDVLTETAVLLSEALQGETGHLIVTVQPPRRFSDFWEERSQTVQTWVQATQIGVDAIVDPTQLIVWTTDLKDGAPLANTTITPNNGSATQTDQQGIASMPLPGGGIQYLVASQGEDNAILPANPQYWDDYGWQQRPLYDELRWHIFDDRTMYRPGEEVHVKGWLRNIQGGSGAISLPAQVSTANYQVYDSQGNEITTGTTAVDGLGGFDLAFTLPENSNLGNAYINLDAGGSGVPDTNSKSRNSAVPNLK